MRALLSLFVTCLIWAAPVASQTKTERESADLAGPVKSVEVYLIDFFMRDSKIEEGKRRPWHSTTYNSDGNIIERVSYDDTGKITGKSRHTYDAKGRNTGHEDLSAILNESSAVPRRDVYVLDAEGLKIEHIAYQSDGSIGTRFVYKYNLKGNLTEEEWYSHTGQLGGRSIYTFDEVGNQTSQSSYDRDGSLNWKNISKYDERGNRIEWIQYQKDVLRYKMVFSYESKGRILEKETFEFNATPNVYTSHAPEPGKVIYTYDDEKRTKEEATYNPYGVLKHKIAYTFDERGNEVGQMMFNGDGSPKDLEIQFYDNIHEPGSPFRGTLSGKSLIEIEYDSHGNWTKKTRLIQSKKGGKPRPYSAEQRVITYY